VLAGVTIDDSPFAPFFSLAMIFWGILFIKFWQRNEAMLSLKWGTMWTDHQSVRRPDFHGVAAMLHSHVSCALCYAPPKWLVLCMHGRQLCMTFNLIGRLPFIQL
jgi:hypothetical protein